MTLAFPFLLTALMLGVQGMAVDDAPLRPGVGKKEIQDKGRQGDEAIGCEAYRADFDMYAVCKKRGCFTAEAATAVLRTSPWIKILQALPCHRNAAMLTGNQNGTERLR